MSNRLKVILQASALKIAGVTGLALALPGMAAAQNVTLPSPYISRALDAVLLPINQDVIWAFNLFAEDTGVFVLSVEPGGVADSYGIMAGDVISVIDGRPIYEPIDLDTFVYFWITQGYYDFIFDVYRGEDYYSYTSTITEELYYQVIDVYSVESWSSYSYESFSYSEWYSEYSSEISETYASSESYIEETASSEEYYSEVTSETSEESMTEEEMTNEELANEAMAEEGAMTEEEMTNEELSNEAMAEDGVMTEEEMTNDELALEAEEEMATEEEFVDDTAMEEDVVDESYEEPVEESYEEPVEESFDDGGDSGGDDTGE